MKQWNVIEDIPSYIYMSTLDIEGKKSCQTVLWTGGRNPEKFTHEGSSEVGGSLGYGN